MPVSFKSKIRYQKLSKSTIVNNVDEKGDIQ